MPTTSATDLSLYNIRASHYFVLQAHCPCKTCKQDTQVIALALPPQHQCLESDVLQQEDDDFTGLGAAEFHDWLFAPEQWYDIAGPAIIMTVAALCDTVTATLQAHYPNYSLSGEGNNRHWQNHCQHCGADIRDGDLHAHTTSVFSPKDPEAAALIRIQRINAPFEAYYGMCWNEGYTMKAALFALIEQANQ
jgi:hypothetical protein